MHPPTVHLVVGGLVVMTLLWRLSRRRLMMLRWGWGIYTLLTVAAVVTGSWDADAHLPYPRPEGFRTHEVMGYVYAWLAAMANLIFWAGLSGRWQRRMAGGILLVMAALLLFVAGRGHLLVFASGNT